MLRRLAYGGNLASGQLAGGSLLGIRIHDNARGIWFSTYPEGEQANVQAGSGNLTIDLGITNIGGADGRIWCRLSEAGAGPTLIDYIAPTPAGQYHLFEVTTNMPRNTLVLDLDWWVSVGGTVIDEGYMQLIIYFVENPNPPPENGDGPTYPTQQECEAAGYYWYDDACHLDPKPVPPEPEIPLEVWVAIGVAGVVVVTLVAVALTG